MSGFGIDKSLESEVDEKTRVKKPPLYKVIIHNDDYTSMEFVVHVLMFFFNKQKQEAVFIMLDVHKKGTGVAGIYTKEIAETKIYQVHQEAKKNGFPLKCTMEKE